MKYAYCDCFSGISGDMFLGALVDAGLPVEILREQLSRLKIPEAVEVVVSETRKGALRATQVDVVVGSLAHSHDHDHEGARDQVHEHAHAHGHEHEHSHEHDHSHEHEPESAPDHEHARERDHRHLADITAMIEGSDLSERVKRTSLAIFQTLAVAEARVHGIEIEAVHFHEVGALDSIVDIVGAAIGLEALGIDRLYASAVPFSGGTVQTEHGTLPVPAPATLEILTRAHALMAPSPAQVELVTPTGAAILATLATFERPNLVVTGVGVGAGRRELPWPNIFRLILGESTAESEHPMVLLETNIDDMNPQLFGHVMNRLFAEGALDVYLTPIYMKKNRPATLLGVVARREDEQALARLILAETSTLGLRVQPVYRYTAQREIKQVATPFGEVPVKVKLLDGRPIQAMPEYDVCARLAGEHNVPLAEVYTAALLAGNALLAG
ncbi:MAG TPA: nickel pincer cofactor biosynthesis protein LarC [Anaerolineaceae bacterium]